MAKGDLKTFNRPVFPKGEQMGVGFHEAPRGVLSHWVVIDSGKIKNVCETFTDGWKPDNAQKNMEQCLTSTGNKVDAVLSENDGMASGVVAALTAQGMAGIPVGGQDGDLTAINRVALGTQTVSVWKNSVDLGKVAAEAANALADGTAMDKISGVAKFNGGKKGVEMNAILLSPTPITKDNINVAIDAGHITKDQACAGVTAGAVPGC
jgi:D-xylose transport system substrate-binding protein